METTIESIVSRFNVEKKEVEELYKKQLEENMEVIGLPQKEAETLAMSQAQAIIARRKLSGRDAYEGVIVGTDGRVMNWADNARKKHADKTKDMKLDDQIKLGYATSDGKPCYVDDKFRTGIIPDSDYRIQYFGIFKDNGKWKYTVINLKNKDEMNKMVIGQEIKIEGFKTSTSTDDYLNLSINDVRIQTLPSSKTPIREYCERMAKKVGNPIAGIRDAETKGKMFFLKNAIVREVRYNLGANKSTIMVLDHFDDRIGIDSVSLWMPPKDKLQTTLREMLPINALFNISGYDGERRQVSGNGIVVWYDEIYEPREVQPPASPTMQAKPYEEKHAPTSIQTTPKSEEEDTW